MTDALFQAVEWRPTGTSGYDVSSDGQVRSSMRYRGSDTPRILRANPNSKGYLAVTLYAGRPFIAFVHRLVAEAFLGPAPQGQEVRHLNGNRLDNRPENLAYGSSRENTLDTIRHGTHVNARKQMCPAGHPYDDANTRLRANGWRACRRCDMARKTR
jgi:hypothetical protein